jgi:magnesium-transporting ATPase (P-type)
MPKNRKVIVGVGICLAIVCLILNRYVHLEYQMEKPNRKLVLKEYIVRCIFQTIFQIAICCYLLFASMKYHLKLLNTVIITSGALKVLLIWSGIYNYKINWSDYWMEVFYGGRRDNILLFNNDYYVCLYSGISFLTFVIILISLVYLKYNGDYTAPDEIEEYEPLKYCPQCGNPVGADENFCTNCGAKVE